MPPSSGKDQADHGTLAGSAALARHFQAFTSGYSSQSASAIASVVATVASFPFDTIKTRMQTSKHDVELKKYSRIPFLAVAKQIQATEGYLGFMRGLTAPLISITVVRTVSMSMYQDSKFYYSRFFEREFGVSPVKHVQTPGLYPNFATVSCFMLAGATAGSFATLISSPFELVKITAQLGVKDIGQGIRSAPHTPVRPKAPQSVVRALGSFQAFKAIIKAHGVRGLYVGFKYHMGRDFIGTATYFGTYESARQILETNYGIPQETSSWISASAGAMCGVASWAIIYPIDSIKSNYQKAAVRAMKGEVVPRPNVNYLERALYRGCLVSMFRSAFINSIFFYVYERLKK